MEHFEKPARKDDAGKPRWDLMPPEALNLVADVLRYGAERYGERNLERGLSHGRLFAAAMRHLWAYWAGEDKDPQSGLPHLAHAAASVLMLLQTAIKRPDLDDRSRMGKDLGSGKILT